MEPTAQKHARVSAFGVAVCSSRGIDIVLVICGNLGTSDLFSYRMSMTSPDFSCHALPPTEKPMPSQGICLVIRPSFVHNTKRVCWDLR